MAQVWHHFGTNTSQIDAKWCQMVPAGRGDLLLAEGIVRQLDGGRGACCQLPDECPHRRNLRGHPEEAVALCDLLRVGRREEVLAAAADLTAALRAISGDRKSVV